MKLITNTAFFEKRILRVKVHYFGLNSKNMRGHAFDILELQLSGLLL